MQGLCASGWALWSVSSGEEARSHWQHPRLRKSLIFMGEETAVLICHSVHLVDNLSRRWLTCPGGGCADIPPAPECHPCRQRSLFLLRDRDCSSTAECRLSLHMSQLLCECQLHAGAAYQPLPVPNTTHLHLKETIKEKNLCFAGLGEAWGLFGVFVVLFIFVFFHPEKIKQITSNKNIRFSCMVTQTLDLAHLDTMSEPI